MTRIDGNQFGPALGDASPEQNTQSQVGTYRGESIVSSDTASTLVDAAEELCLYVSEQVEHKSLDKREIHTEASVEILHAEEINAYLDAAKTFDDPQKLAALCKHMQSAQASPRQLAREATGDAADEWSDLAPRIRVAKDFLRDVYAGRVALSGSNGQAILDRAGWEQLDDRQKQARLAAACAWIVDNALDGNWRLLPALTRQIAALEGLLSDAFEEEASDWPIRLLGDVPVVPYDCAAVSLHISFSLRADGELRMRFRHDGQWPRSGHDQDNELYHFERDSVFCYEFDFHLDFHPERDSMLSLDEPPRIEVHLVPGRWRKDYPEPVAEDLRRGQYQMLDDLLAFAQTVGNAAPVQALKDIIAFRKAPTIATAAAICEQYLANETLRVSEPTRKAILDAVIDKRRDPGARVLAAMLAVRDALEVLIARLCMLAAVPKIEDLPGGTQQQLQQFLQQPTSAGFHGLFGAFQASWDVADGVPSLSRLILSRERHAMSLTGDQHTAESA